jgi:hypothetical protein
LNINNLSLSCQPLLLNHSLTTQTGALSNFFHPSSSIRAGMRQPRQRAKPGVKNVAFIAARSSPKVDTGKKIPAGGSDRLPMRPVQIIDK